MKILRIAGAALALAAAALVQPALAESQVVLKFPHEAPETAIKGRTAKLFAELVEKYSGGALRVEVYPGAQLIPSKDEVRAAIRGQVDIIAPQTSYFSSLDPAFDLFYQPLLFGDAVQAMGAVAGDLGRDLMARLERVGLIGLAIWHDGPGYLFVKGEPVRTIEDIAGRKIRVFPSAPLEEGLRTVGAIPVSILASEVYLALQQGVVEGVITTPTYAAPARWYEVVKGMTRMPMFVGGYGVTINKASWGKLSDKQREALTRAVREAETWNYDEALRNLAAAEKTLADNGVRIADLTPEQLSAWRTRMEAVYDKQSAELKALIGEVRKTY